MGSQTTGFANLPDSVYEPIRGKALRQSVGCGKKLGLP
jgi:hypothetical protein